MIEIGLTRTLQFSFLLCWAIACADVRAAEPVPVKIKEVRRLEDTVARLGGDGDNWHMTWTERRPRGSRAMRRQRATVAERAASSVQQPSHHNSRRAAEARICGHARLSELLVGPGPREISRYYGFGILAIDDTIYQFLSTPDQPFNAPRRRSRGSSARS